MSTEMTLPLSDAVGTASGHSDRVSWSDVEPMLRDRLMRIIENDPQVLLEVDGGPVGMEADIILATLHDFRYVRPEEAQHGVYSALWRAGWIPIFAKQPEGY